MALHFLFVDDETLYLLIPRIVRKVFPDAEIYACATVPQALVMLRRIIVDCVVTNHGVNGRCGLAIITAARAAPRAPKTIMITSLFAMHSEEELSASGCDAIITKPFRLHDIKEALTQLFAHSCTV